MSFVVPISPSITIQKLGVEKIFIVKKNAILQQRMIIILMGTLNLLIFPVKAKNCFFEFSLFFESLFNIN